MHPQAENNLCTPKHKTQQPRSVQHRRDGWRLRPPRSARHHRDGRRPAASTLPFGLRSGLLCCEMPALESHAIQNENTAPQASNNTTHPQAQKPLCTPGPDNCSTPRPKQICNPQAKQLCPWPRQNYTSPGPTQLCTSRPRTKICTPKRACRTIVE